jgi:ribosomal protein S18 acetylase RimI-like enzyme
MSHSLTICKAVPQHLTPLKALADQSRDEIGFLHRAKIQEAIVASRILTVVTEGQPIGFTIYRHRKLDSRTTLSEICIASEWRRRGLGRMLIRALCDECQAYARTEIQLKCPVDLSANAFYQQMGFQHIATEQGRVRQLNVWRLPIPQQG